MVCYQREGRGAHPKKVYFPVQSGLALSEQSAHFTTAEEILDFTSVLLCFKESMYLM
jgi:hypothetical protein